MMQGENKQQQRRWQKANSKQKTTRKKTQCIKTKINTL
jgi:SRSO17 transposase